MIYDIIGDIHGCYEEFLELIVKLGYNIENNIIYHTKDSNRILCSVGDINDRGPYSTKIIELFYHNRNNHILIYNPGNHDNKLARYFKGNKIKLSGSIKKTIKEFETTLSPNIEYKSIITWFINHILNHSNYTILENNNLVITHGGFANYILQENINNNTTRSLCLYGKVKDGKRLPWYNDYNGNAYIVYGHMPTNKPRIINKTFGIDTGCCFGWYLTALTMIFSDENTLQNYNFTQIKAKQIYYNARFDKESIQEFIPPQYMEMYIDA